MKLTSIPSTQAVTSSQGEEIFCTGALSDQVIVPDALYTVENIQLSSESQAKLSYQYIKEGTELLLDIKHPQVEQIRAFKLEGRAISIVKVKIEGLPCCRRVSDEGRFTEEETINLLYQVLSVLTHIHDKGMSHGNLSPDTIYLRSEDGLPILTNFKYLTDAFEPAGLPSNTSFRSEVLRVTGAPTPKGYYGDLYCLALTAIVLFTGRPLAVLFDRSTQREDWKEYQHMTSRFGDVVDLMLSLDPNNQFKSAEEPLFAFEISVTDFPRRSSTSRVQACILPDNEAVLPSISVLSSDHNVRYRWRRKYRSEHAMRKRDIGWLALVLLLLF